MAVETNSANNDNGGKRHEDIITGAPGSHPVGTGVGAASGGAAAAAVGAAIGSTVGPVGTIIGGAIGAVAGAIGGGAAGKSIAEDVNPTAEDAYWQENHKTRPYVSPGYSYDSDYGPAYRYGWESTGQNTGRKFDEVESSLSRDWEAKKEKSRLNWEQAKGAVRDAWDRVNSRREASKRDDDPEVNRSNYTGELKHKTSAATSSDTDYDS